VIDDQHGRHRDRRRQRAGYDGDGENGHVEIYDSLFGMGDEHDGDAFIALGDKTLPPVFEHRLFGAQMV